MEIERQETGKAPDTWMGGKRLGWGRQDCAGTLCGMHIIRVSHHHQKLHSSYSFFPNSTYKSPNASVTYSKPHGGATLMHQQCDDARRKLGAQLADTLILAGNSTAQSLQAKCHAHTQAPPTVELLAKLGQIIYIAPTKGEGGTPCERHYIGHVGTFFLFF